MQDYAGNEYLTTTIGDAVWMAENMRFKGVRCDIPSEVPNFEENYGCLYKWADAMKLNSSCNSTNSYCNDLIQANHQGICPDGWHVPSDTDFENLLAVTHGQHLRAASWDGGQDRYGFGAVPAGSAYYSPTLGYEFEGFGFEAKFWSTTGDSTDSYQANCLVVKKSSQYDGAEMDNTLKDSYLSVRCVKDAAEGK